MSVLTELKAKVEKIRADITRIKNKLPEEGGLTKAEVDELRNDLDLLDAENPEPEEEA